MRDMTFEKNWVSLQSVKTVNANQRVSTKEKTLFRNGVRTNWSP